jgi:hypothetical protein
MPTTGVFGVLRELGPRAAAPNGTTESAPGAAAAAGLAAREGDPRREVRAAITAPEVARSWTHETVAVVRTSTATPTGNPTARSARKLLIRCMKDHSTHAVYQHPLRNIVINSAAAT